MLTLLGEPRIRVVNARDHHSVSGGEGVNFLSLTNYLFQPGSVARGKLEIISDVCIEQFLEEIIYFTQSSKLVISKILQPLPPPPHLENEWWPP